MSIWNGLIWLRIGFNDRLLWNKVTQLRFYKIRRIFVRISDFCISRTAAWQFELVKVKVNFAIEQAMKCERGSRGRSSKGNGDVCLIFPFLFEDALRYTEPNFLKFLYDELKRVWKVMFVLLLNILFWRLLCRDISVNKVNRYSLDSGFQWMAQFQFPSPFWASWKLLENGYGG